MQRLCAQRCRLLRWPCGCRPLRERLALGTCAPLPLLMLLPAHFVQRVNAGMHGMLVTLLVTLQRAHVTASTGNAVCSINVV